MQLTKDKRGECSILTVQGRLDSTSASKFEAEALAWLGGGGKAFVLDMAGISFLSSAALRVLLSMAKRVGRSGGRVVLAAPNAVVSEVLEISNFAAMFTICQTLEEGIAAATRGLAPGVTPPPATPPIPPAPSIASTPKPVARSMASEGTLVIPPPQPTAPPVAPATVAPVEPPISPPVPAPRPPVPAKPAPISVAPLSAPKSAPPLPPASPQPPAPAPAAPAPAPAPVAPTLPPAVPRTSPATRIPPASAPVAPPPQNPPTVPPTSPPVQPSPVAVTPPAAPPIPAPRPTTLVPPPPRIGPPVTTLRKARPTKVEVIVGTHIIECHDGDIIGLEGTVAPHLFKEASSLQPRHVLIGKGPEAWFVMVPRNVQIETRLDDLLLTPGVRQNLSGEHRLKIADFGVSLRLVESQPPSPHDSFFHRLKKKLGPG